jgi:hypothetical protein
MATGKFRIIKRRTGKTSGSNVGSGKETGNSVSLDSETGREEPIGSGTESSASIAAGAIPTTIAGTGSETEDIEIHAQGNVVDPAQVPPRRGRGRPRKVDVGMGVSSSPPPTRAKKKIPGATFEKLLIGLHAGMAELLKQPEFAIDADEATVLREAFFGMAEAYGWSLGTVSPKTEATINAAIAVSIVYGPRVKRAMDKPKRPKVAQSPTILRTQTAQPKPEPIKQPDIFRSGVKPPFESQVVEESAEEVMQQ